jgi:uncharacterized protein
VTGKRLDAEALHLRTDNLAAPDLEVVDTLHRCVVINVNKTYGTRDLIDATRYAWKISPQRARQADYVLAALRGIVVGVFVADAWLPATSQNFPGFPPADPRRFGFIGHEAPESIKRLYLGKRVPPLPQGAQNPIHYIAPA